VIIAVPKEIAPGEHRVALIPDVAKRLANDAIEIRVERGAGVAASFSDEEYAAAGATVVDTEPLWREANVIVKVQGPLREAGRDELALLEEGVVLVGMLQPLVNRTLVSDLAKRKVTGFSLDALPRITRAQPMDVLSSMSTVAGYKAVLLAAAAMGRFFPMLTTAAGTIPPARVLILGAGVAGLQAIATARRLGAIVQAFDVRPAVKEQVESLGAKFVSPEVLAADAETAGGYAKALSEEQHERELELIHQHVRNVDVVITTALIPGKPAPLLITEDMMRDMKPGAVIVDLAAEAGGNCAVTEAGKDVVRHGVTVLAPLNLPASMPTHASQMYSRNMSSFLNHLIKGGQVNLDFDDEIIAGTCITHGGQVIHEATQRALQGGSSG
jgi:NAD(P) transhydrogenase subunit alpha